MIITSKKVNKEFTTIPSTTNHIFVVDVSGSMAYELPLIRTQLKNKLSQVMKEGDTISIVWFSGKNESGILKEEVEVKSLKTLSDLNDAIDKWLKPIGLTAFCKPLQYVHDIVNRVKINRPNSGFSLIFLTDGYNNDCSWSDVRSKLQELETEINNSCFVEYGYYADSKRLTEMAAILGGEKISCSGFDEFEPVFNNRIVNSCSGKKVEVEVTDSIYDFCFAVADNAITLYNINNNKILVPADIGSVYYFSDSEVSAVADDAIVYAGVYVLADKLMLDEAEKLFSVLCDGYFYKKLSNCYGKQKLNDFKTEIKACVFDRTKQFPEGKTQIKVDDSAYCLLNLFQDLIDLDVRVYPYHKSFVYNRIGRKRVEASSVLSEEDREKLANASTFSEATEILSEIKHIKTQFIEDSESNGYPVKDLVWNEERANLSLRITFTGKVVIDENKYGITEIPSFRFKTYTFIRDGIVNINKLPVSYDNELIHILRNNGIGFEINENLIVIDLTALPIINRKMVKSISAKTLAEKEWELIKIQAHKKVYDFYRKQLFPRTSTGFVEKYGSEAAEFLKDLGITDYNGYHPKTVNAESTDFYMALTLQTKIKGLSSLPKVEDVQTKIRSGKALKLSETIMEEAITNYQKQMDSEIYSKLDSEKQKEVLKNYLESKVRELNSKRIEIMRVIAEIKFSLILSRKWFKEFKNYDENKLNLVVDKQNLDITFALTEKEEKI